MPLLLEIEKNSIPTHRFSKRQIYEKKRKYEKKCQQGFFSRLLVGGEKKFCSSTLFVYLCTAEVFFFMSPVY